MSISPTGALRRCSRAGWFVDVRLVTGAGRGCQNQRGGSHEIGSYGRTVNVTVVCRRG